MTAKIALKSIDLEVAKDSNKFSSAHFTLFPDGTREALHGHNYYVQARVGIGVDLKDFIDINVIKKCLKESLADLDEKILLPRSGKMVAIGPGDNPEELEVSFADHKRYVFPADECVMLDVENITMEYLGSYLGQEFYRRILNTGHRVGWVELSVTETRGQTVNVRLEAKGG